MSDITKARLFLKHRASDLQHLTSFGLMLSTAEKQYRDIKMRQTSNADLPGTWDQVEVEKMIDVSVLRFLKKNGRLPENVNMVFRADTSNDTKKNLALKWYNS